MIALAAVAFAFAPPFSGSVASIGPELRSHMTSWHRGCPVGVGDLRLLTLTYWGFDDRAHPGRLVVNKREARAVLRAMRTLYEARFPIRRMQLVEAYGSNDDRSMAADNTSGFNCRRVEGNRSWSAHAYGLAIDIDPLENPEVRGSEVLPPAGVAFVDRSRRARGMIRPGDVVVRAFARIGWKW